VRAEPIYRDRAKLILGGEGESNTKGIPGFWARVFASHEAFEDMLSNQDVEVLKLLTDVRVERSEMTRGSKTRYAVKIIFTFAANDFFSESELSKTYLFADKGESVAVESEGCEISWKEGALSK
jgi:nucleosome assembly protein 1-like 1